MLGLICESPVPSFLFPLNTPSCEHATADGRRRGGRSTRRVATGDEQVDAGELSALFRHPGDLTEPVFGIVPIGVATVAIAICVVGLVRGRLGKSVLTAGIVTLPVLAFALADFVLLDRSKETQFCTSCHLMQPIHDSTVGDDGSLASAHVSRGLVPTAQSCYTCHSGYGMWGDTNAKMAGVNHMMHTVLGSYEFPLKLRRPYDINACLACHAETTGFRNVDMHAMMEEALLSRDMGCTGTCHPAAHPPEALSGNGSAS